MNEEEKHKEILAEIKNLRQEVVSQTELQALANKKFDEHAESDRLFQEEMLPVLNAFKNKKIVRMAIEEETKTWVFYVKSVTSFAVAMAGMWAILKYFLTKM